MNTVNRTPVRVQKYISQAGLASRRQAEVMLGQGRIAINGERVTSPGARVVPGTDTVSLDGRIVRPAPLRWVVFHKPAGVLCTRTDPRGGETIYDLLPEWAGGLRYVGRLDRDTSGLLLLTNEGDLAAALAHPSGRIEREYQAGVAGKITAGALRRLKRGVDLEDGPARPKRVRRVELDEDESRETLAFLFDHATDPDNVHVHHWRDGDFVMWDNRCSMHAAVYDHGDQPRHLHRVMCEGERPFE